MIMDDCSIQDVSAARTVLTLLGPSSSSLLGSVLGAPVPALEPDASGPVIGGVNPPAGATAPLYASAPVIGGLTVIADRSWGVPGLELHVPPADAEALFQRLIEGGAVVPTLADASGVSDRTFQRWLAEGRAKPGSDYADLAKAFDAARPAELMTGPMTDDEFELHLAAAIRSKNTQAMKIYADRRKGAGADDDSKPAADPLASVHQLRAQRATGT